MLRIRQKYITHLLDINQAVAFQRPTLQTSTLARNEHSLRLSQLFVRVQMSLSVLRREPRVSIAIKPSTSRASYHVYQSIIRT